MNFESDQSTAFHVNVMSFGFKYGIPIDADIVMDVRFLPNPYYVKELREKTGNDQAVYDYVMNSEMTEEFYQQFIKMLRFVMPGYQKKVSQVLRSRSGVLVGNIVQWHWLIVLEKLYKRNIR